MFNFTLRAEKNVCKSGYISIIYYLLTGSEEQQQCGQCPEHQSEEEDEEVAAPGHQQGHGPPQLASHQVTQPQHLQVMSRYTARLLVVSPN